MNLLHHKSLHRLGRPATIAALGLLLVNDHLLRRVWPSWLTGKLGDVAWLFAAPLALALVLSLAVDRLPLRRGWREGLVLGCSWGGIGAVFALAKTVPAFHAWLTDGASFLLGFQVGWRLDPTDLLALPALVASGLWWADLHRLAIHWPAIRPCAVRLLAMRSLAMRPPAMQQPTSHPRAIRPPTWAWLLLPCTALLTVANSPAPDPGIFCVRVQDDQLHAFAGYTVFTSTDGGLTWQEGGPDTRERPCADPWDENGLGTVSDPTQPDVRYRYARGQSIEMSTDAGATWQTAYDHRPASEAEIALVQRSLTGYRSWEEGPLDAAVDPVTGNAVFAMGSLGVLVRTADGAWTWAAVGPNYRIQMDTPGDIVSLLSGQLFLALALTLLSLGTLSMRLGQGGALPILVILAWLLWPVCVFFFSPELAYGYGLFFTWIGMAGLGVLLLPATVISVLRLSRAARPAARRVVMVAVAAGLLFLLPFLLWAANALPRYWWAAGFAVVLGVGALIGGARWASRGAG